MVRTTTVLLHHTGIRIPPSVNKSYLSEQKLIGEKSLLRKHKGQLYCDRKGTYHRFNRLSIWNTLCTIQTKSRTNVVQSTATARESNAIDNGCHTSLGSTKEEANWKTKDESETRSGDEKKYHQTQWTSSTTSNRSYDY